MAPNHPLRAPRCPLLLSGVVRMKVSRAWWGLCAGSPWWTAMLGTPQGPVQLPSRACAAGQRLSLR